MNRQSSIHLFRFRGIDVFLHSSWFLVAIFEIQGGFNIYSSRVWNAFEYLGLFLIVVLHEFGHALACRQVGGNAKRKRESDRALAIGRSCVCRSAAAAGCNLMEHRGRAARQCSFSADPVSALQRSSRCWLAGQLARRLHSSSRFVANRHCSVCIQHASNLSAGWRADPAIFAVVCHGTRPQPYHSDGDWFYRSSRVHCFSCLDSLCMVWRPCRLHALELLGRLEACPCPIPAGKDSAPRRIRMPMVQIGAAVRELLEVRTVRNCIRHLRHARGLSPVRSAVSGDAMRRLRQVQPDRGMDGGGCDFLGPVEGCYIKALLTISSACCVANQRIRLRSPGKFRSTTCVPSSPDKAT